jgi:C4-dicarboxylate transporter DctM subunit
MGVFAVGKEQAIMGYDALVAVSCFAGMLVLIFLGLPIFISMLAAAGIGFWLLGGFSYTLTQFATGPYNITGSYTFAVVPMFILMGILAGESGLAEGVYIAVTRWLARIRGGSLMATIGAAAIFGACSGVELASVAVFTKVALPELDKFGYNKRISLGCIAAGSILSALIPPSVPIIIFCILAQFSIGQSLIAGIFPGILVALMLIGTVALIGIINPNNIPRVDVKVTWKERFSSLTLIWPIIGLFILVIGGIYAGIFPPIVGGAIGASGILIYTLARRVTGKKIFNAFRETALTMAQLFPLVIAGFLFGRFIALSGLPETFIEMIANLGIHPIGVMAIVVVIYIFLGCIMELFSILIITIPLVVPILTSLGFDPLTIVIVLVFMGNLAGLTPPIGLVSFFMAGVAKVDPTEVFQGLFIFICVLIVAVWIIILVPPLTTWLPSLLY